MSERIERFEDLEAWQQARMQNYEIGMLTREDAFKTDFDFKSQIRRSALSVMNNIAEGFERLAILEKRKFYDYARGSNGEIRSMTYAGEDFYPQFSDQFQELRQRCIRIGKLITGLIRSTEQRHS
jgi:four helix bundle protein